jgi:CBS domain-containing protein
MTVGRVCVREVDLAEPHEPVQVAAARMNDRNVGTLVVVGSQGEPIGIVTDRDLAIRVVAYARDPLSTRVAEVMTQCPVSVHEDTPLEEALREMRRGPFRRVPVVDSAGKLVGLLSLDDILDLLAEEFGMIRELLSRESPSGLV